MCAERRLRSICAWKRFGSLTTYRTSCEDWSDCADIQEILFPGSKMHLYLKKKCKTLRIMFDLQCLWCCHCCCCCYCLQDVTRICYQTLKKKKKKKKKKNVADDVAGVAHRITLRLRARRHLYLLFITSWRSRDGETLMLIHDKDYFVLVLIYCTKLSTKH